MRRIRDFFDDLCVDILPSVIGGIGGAIVGNLIIFGLAYIRMSMR